MREVPEQYEKKLSSEIGSADTEFEYIYTHYHLAASAKDDFYEVKDILARHQTFVQNLREGRLAVDALRAWVATPQDPNSV